MLVRIILMIVLAVSMVAPTRAAEQSLPDSIKKIFSTPTPTPSRKKKRSAKRISPSPSPSPKKKSSPLPAKELPTPSVAPPIEKKKPSATASPSASPRRRKKPSPTPTPSELPSTSTTPSVTPSPSAAPESSPTKAPESPSPPRLKKRGAPNATLTPDAIKGFEDYPASVQRLLVSALELTRRDLDYKYGSADPATGGMDCSGFVYFVLKQNGVDDVPRDSSEQYVWLRREGKFEPVLSQKDDSFEFENLRPGDVLFWTGTYSIERDPPITHAMIYLGREKKTGQTVMVGASDGRLYQGQSRNGVSVFDFKIQRAEKTDDGKLRPTFVGYGHVPGLRN